jgi:hypothetical protein
MLRAHHAFEGHQIFKCPGIVNENGLLQRMEGGLHRDTGFLGNQFLGFRRLRHDRDPASAIESICKSLPDGFVIAQATAR